MTTPVPPPVSGNVDQTVAPKPEVTKKAVRLDQPSVPAPGLRVEITRIRKIAARAQLPGEVAGPALALTVSIKNNSRATVDLSTVVVTLTDSGASPGNEMSAKPSKPFSGRLSRQQTATAVYVFTVPPDRRSPITVNITLAGEVPVLVYKGDVT
ncbi:MAG TPA: hypothetical protein VF635_15820 [Propionibacteriaceae bacterium]